MESSGGGYFEPPDFDFVQIAEQASGQRLSDFVIETLKNILQMNFENALSCESESVYYTQEKDFYIQF
jgi:hypothetical protein